MKKLLLLLLLACVIVFAVIGGIWAFASEKSGEITLVFEDGISEPTEAAVPLYKNKVSRAGTHGNTTKMPDAPVRVGHTFLAWVLNEKEYQAGAYVPSGLTAESDGAVVTAKWETNRYKITFKTGTSDVDAPVSLAAVFEQGISSLPNMEGARKNYFFKGWWTEVNGGGREVSAGDVFEWTENITLYAKWELDPSIDLTFPFVINFISNLQNTNVPVSMTIYQSDDLNTVLPDMEAAGKIFFGWFIADIEFVTIGDCYEYLFDGTNDQSVIFLTAAWRDDPSIDTTYPFIVRFASSLLGVASPAAKAVYQGDDLTQPLPVLTSTGPAFLGWTFNGTAYVTYQDCYDYMKESGKKNIMLTGVWGANPYPFKVNFDSNLSGVSAPAAITVVQGDVLTAELAELTEFGYKFLGWFIEDTKFTTLNDCYIHAGSTGTKEWTLKAKWEDLFPIKINFNANLAGTANPASKTIQRSDDLTQTLPAPSSSGSVFRGWFIDGKEFKTLSDCFDYSEKTEQKEFTLAASWADLFPFTINFNANMTGITNPASVTVENEGGMTAPLPALSHTEHRFLGWFIETEEFKTVQDCFDYYRTHTETAVNLKANWEFNPYPLTITFNANLSGVASPASITVLKEDSLATALPQLSLADWTFNGWFIDAAEFKTYNDCFTYAAAAAQKTAALTGKWTAVIHTFKFTITNTAAYFTATSSRVHTITVTDNNFNISLPAVTSSNVTLTGWKMGGSFVQPAGNIASVKNMMSAGVYHAELTAEFTEVVRTISFNANGGDAISDWSVTSADSGYKLPVANRVEPPHFHKGWFYNGVKVETVGDVLALSHTNTIIVLKAEWDEAWLLSVYPLFFDGSKYTFGADKGMWVVANSTVTVDITFFGTAFEGYVFSYWRLETTDAGAGVGANHAITFQIPKNGYKISAVFIKA